MCAGQDLLQFSLLLCTAGGIEMPHDLVIKNLGGSQGGDEEGAGSHE